MYLELPAPRNVDEVQGAASTGNQSRSNGTRALWDVCQNDYGVPLMCSRASRLAYRKLSYAVHILFQWRQANQRTHRCLFHRSFDVLPRHLDVAAAPLSRSTPLRAHLFLRYSHYLREHFPVYLTRECVSKRSLSQQEISDRQSGLRPDFIFLCPSYIRHHIPHLGTDH